MDWWRSLLDGGFWRMLLDRVTRNDTPSRVADDGPQLAVTPPRVTRPRNGPRRGPRSNPPRRPRSKCR
jgi:hypothetical protein